MKARQPTKFWKVRDKKSGWFVVKGVPPHAWWYHVVSNPNHPNHEYYKELLAKEEQKEGYSPYATLGIVGRTYSTLSGAKTMLAQLASQIKRKHRFPEDASTFDITRDTFELVEFEVREVAVLDDRPIKGLDNPGDIDGLLERI